MKPNNHSWIFFIEAGLFLFLLAYLFSALPTVSAITYPQNVEIDLKTPCTLDGFPCSSSATCNLTIQFPNNGSYLLNNIALTNLGNGDFNTTIIFPLLGDYQREVNCQDSGQNDTLNDLITITQTGSVISTAQGIIYIIFLAVLIFLFLLCLAGAIYLPWDHGRTEEGSIVSVNDLKYLKIILFVFSYLSLMFIFGIMRGLTANHLFLTGFSGVFNVIYWILFSLLWPLIVLSIIIMTVAFLKNLEIKESILRNIPLR